MKTKLFSLLFAMMASTITLFAKYQIGDLYYNLDETNYTAEVTYLEYNSGHNYSGLTSVNIPSSITYLGHSYSVVSIGESAFDLCSHLTSITIPNSIREIGYRAFASCSGLTAITIPNSITSIGDYAFDGCSGFSSIVLPSGVTSIGASAFRSCSNLTSITIPNSVTSIGNFVFQGCSSLTSITFPNSVTSFGYNPVYECPNLSSITIQSGNSVYDSRNNCNAIVHTASNTLISGCRNTIIPNSITSIGDCSFGGCSGISSIVLPSGVTSIGAGAFWGCSGLASITIPNSVTTINDYAFYECTGLINITVPNNVTSIGYEAFYGAPNVIYNGTAFGAPWGARCINGYVEGFLVFSNALKDTLCSCSTQATGEMIIPNSVTIIGESAFRDCSGLTSVSIPNSVISIGSYAFWGCSGLTSITIPNSVTSIGRGVFYGCSGLTSITIPNSVTSIGNYAFDGCSNLMSFTCYAVNCPGVNSYTFERIPSSTILYVLDEVLFDYEFNGGWNNYFSEIKPITSSVTIGSTGWASFSHEYPLDFTDANRPDGLTAYQVQATNISSVDNTIAPSAINTTVAANTGLLLSGEAGTYDILVTSSGSDLSSTNKMVAVTEDGTVVNNAGYYVLMNDNGTAVLAHTGEHAATLNKGKAYLDLSGIALAPESLRIVVEENNSTGVVALEANSETVRKFIANGKLYIQSNGITYDALGHIVK